MPIGPYEDFDACVRDQVKKGHSDESAHRICGAMKRDLEGSVRLTDRQLSALKRIVRGPDGATIDPVLARQLESKGLVLTHHKTQRTQWGKTVPGTTLMKCTPTDAGKKFIADMVGDVKASSDTAKNARASASQQPAVKDAEVRMIKQVGMPFPIAEDKQFFATQAFARGKPFEKTVPVSLLTATQRDFDPEKVQSMMHSTSTDDQEPIHVVHHQNRYVIPDGHHRAMAAKFRGDTSVPALVVET